MARNDEAAVKAKRWIRHPDRRDMILVAAAQLFRERGYHAVGIDDIGGEAGITGPGVYRHFESKQAVLVALAERVTNRLLDGARLIVDRELSARQVVEELIELHLEVILSDKAVATVFLHEERNLPEEVRNRLRLWGRQYVGIWSEHIAQSCPGVGSRDALVMTQAVIGLLNSVIYYQDGAVARGRLKRVLAASASAAVFEAAVPEAGSAS